MCIFLWCIQYDMVHQAYFCSRRLILFMVTDLFIHVTVPFNGSILIKFFALYVCYLVVSYYSCSSKIILNFLFTSLCFDLHWWAGRGSGGNTGGSSGNYSGSRGNMRGGPNNQSARGGGSMRGNATTRGMPNLQLRGSPTKGANPWGGRMQRQGYGRGFGGRQGG